MPRPIMRSHLTENAAVAQATAGKVLASRCARQGQSTRRGMISPPVKCIISTTWYLYRAAGSSSSSSCVRGYQPRPSRPSWPGAAWMACADKAHNGGNRASAVKDTQTAKETKVLCNRIKSRLITSRRELQEQVAACDRPVDARSAGDGRRMHEPVAHLPHNAQYVWPLW